MGPVRVHGLPTDIRGCLFDLDGVVTDTARVHAAAWKRTFDDLLARIDTRGSVARYDGDDYRDLIDGRPREDGVRAFLQSRHLAVPEGHVGDDPEQMTVQGIAARKDALFEDELRTAPPRPLPGAVAYLDVLRGAGLRTGLVSSSRHAVQVVQNVGIADRFDVVVDGNDIANRSLHGKPAPDAYLLGAQALGMEPSTVAVVEDAVAGVAAGRNGGFGYVVGIGDDERADVLRHAGADVVVVNLGSLVAEG